MQLRNGIFQFSTFCITLGCMMYAHPYIAMPPDIVLAWQHIHHANNLYLTVWLINGIKQHWDVCCIGAENNIPKWRQSRREKEVKQYCAGLRHLILVGEFGCQGNSTSRTAEALKYIFMRSYKIGGKESKLRAGVTRCCCITGEAPKQVDTVVLVSAVYCNRIIW